MKPLQGQFSFYDVLRWTWMLLEALNVVINHRQEQKSRRLAADNFPDMQLFVSPGEKGIPGGCISCHYYCMCPPPPYRSRRLCHRRPRPPPPPRSQLKPPQGWEWINAGGSPMGTCAECISNHLALSLSNCQSECLGKIFSLKTVAGQIQKPRCFPPGCQTLPQACCRMIARQEISQITNPLHKMVFIYNKSNRFRPLKGTRHLIISNSSTCARRVFASASCVPILYSNLKLSSNGKDFHSRKKL